LEILLRESDIVTLHVPLRADTYQILGRERIRGMKEGAILINTGRGALVDTGALTEALDRGRLGGAALDVIEGEEGIFYFNRSGAPLEHQYLRRLQAMPYVIITPHTAYYTERVLWDTAVKTIENCLAFARASERASRAERSVACESAKEKPAFESTREKRAAVRPACESAERSAACE
jgi:D-specific alpha-keto acid dehydrogenase